MNKTLKFRAWTGSKMEHNVMVGFLGAFYVGGMNPKDTACMSEFNTIYSEQVPIMQCSGLVDWEGKLIYEGDICRESLRDDVFITFLVTFENGTFTDDVGEQTLFDIVERSSVKVIGNIYENPNMFCKECAKKNQEAGFKCSKHFVKQPCCSSKDYNKHSHTCINND